MLTPSTTHISRLISRIFFLYLTMRILILFLTFSTLTIQLSVDAQTLDWAKQLGGTEGDRARDMILDDSGNLIITGYFTDVSDFDPSLGVFNLSTTGPADEDIYICKLSNQGNLVWAKSMGAGQMDHGLGLAIDSSGNIYSSGFFTGTVDFDPGAGVFSLTSAGLGPDGFILKLDSLGNFIWAKQLTSSGGVEVQEITVNKTGHVYVSGAFSASLNFDPGFSNYSLVPNNTNVFVARYSSNGAFVWARHFVSNSLLQTHDLAYDQNSNILIAGYFVGNVDFDPGPGTFNVSCVGSSDGSITALDSSGNFLWVRIISGIGTQDVNSILIDGQNNIYSTGNFGGTCDFDPDPANVHNVTALGVSDVFILKLDSLGKFVWVDNFGGNSGSGFSISADADNFLFVTGFFQGTVDFDPGFGIYNMASPGNQSIFISKVDAYGNLVWARQMGGTSNNAGDVIINDNEGNIYSTGLLQGTTDFEPGAAVVNLTTAGNSDVFVYKMTEDSCSNIVLYIDSMHSVSCLNTGFASANVVNSSNGLFQWNTSPITFGNETNFSNGGIYSVTYFDSSSFCMLHRDFLIDEAEPFGSSHDLNASIITTTFIPGFNATIFVDGFNDVCDTVSGQVLLVLDTLVDYNTAVPLPDYINGDTLIWDFTGLNYDSLHITPQVFVTTSTSAVMGSKVCFTLIITPIINDYDSANNIKTYCFPVINSYDPNDKQVYPQGACDDKFILKDEILTYTIRFQNTGNSNAVNVYIIDTLPAALNINTVRILGNSHYLITEILPGNVLKFRFDNIQLPDSASDEENSHGYVIYETMPLSSVVSETPIENTAHIYFDFNPAIITNTVANILVDTIPTDSSLCFNTNGIDFSLKELHSLLVYPNPLQNIVTIKSADQIIQSVKVYDIFGRDILSKPINSLSCDLDLGVCPNGMYILTVKYEGGFSSYKLIKE